MNAVLTEVGVDATRRADDSHSWDEQGFKVRSSGPTLAVQRQPLAGIRVLALGIRGAPRSCRKHLFLNHGFHDPTAMAMRFPVRGTTSRGPPSTYSQASRRLLGRAAGKCCRMFAADEMNQSTFRIWTGESSDASSEDDCLERRCISDLDAALARAPCDSISLRPSVLAHVPPLSSCVPLPAPPVPVPSRLCARTRPSLHLYHGARVT